ncbi:MAG: radical SAM peptide maturase [Ignavibacteriae bacterium]|nr:radical SAM peptide maturase [Ignavibacteriota bacterium]
MNDTFFFNTDQNNYLYSLNKRQVIIVTPLIEKIFDIVKDDRKISLIEVKSKLNKETNFSDEEIEYSLSKFFLLRNNGFFEELETYNIVNKRLSLSDIEYSLANLKSICFEVTDRCNLNCTYCAYSDFYKDYDERTGKLLSEAVALNALKYVLKYLKSGKNSSSEDHSLNIAFYGGEPTLNVEVIRAVINYVADNDIKVHYTMTTNSVLLKKYIKLFVENNFNLLISLDGEEKNNVYRNFFNGKNSFNKIYKNLIYVKRNYPEFFNNNISFNCVLNGTSNIIEINRFFKKEFGKLPQYSEISRVGVDKNKIEEFNKVFKSKNDCFDNLAWNQKKETLDAPERIKSMKFLFNYSNNFYNEFIQIGNNHNKKRKLPTGTCLPFDRKFYVSVNGKILPCQMIDQKYYYGKINNELVDLDLSHTADVTNKMYDKLKDQCEKCYNLITCGSCIYTNLIENGDKIYCANFTSHSSFINDLTRNFSVLESHPELYDEIVSEAILR